MKCKLTNISFIDGYSKDQKYCFFVKPIEGSNNVVFLGFRNYNFKKKVGLKTFSLICEEYTLKPYKYIHNIIFAIKKFDYHLYDNDNSIFFTIMDLIDLKVDAKSPIKFKIRSLK